MKKTKVEEVTNEAINQLKYYSDNIKLDSLKKYAVIFIGSDYKIIEI